MELDTKGCWQLVGAGALTTLFVGFVFIYLPISCSERIGRNNTTVAAVVKIEVAKGCEVRGFRIADQAVTDPNGKTVSVRSLTDSIVEANLGGEIVRRNVKLAPGEVTLTIGCKPGTFKFQD